MLRWFSPPVGIGSAVPRPLPPPPPILLLLHVDFARWPTFPPSNSSIPSHLKQTEFFFPFWAEKKRGPPYRYLAKLWRKFWCSWKEFPQTQTTKPHLKNKGKTAFFEICWFSRTKNFLLASHTISSTCGCWGLGRGDRDTPPPP